MQVIGYKCFNEDLTNRYGINFEIGKIYSTKGEIKFGNVGNGFHFCKNIEDTFRYFDIFAQNVTVCIVRGFGNIVEYEDEYNGYYNMYVSENIEILRELTREEIIQTMLNSNEIKVCRFIQTFKLTNEEIEMFKKRFSSYSIISKYIEYYQLNNKEIFKIKTIR